MPMAGCPADAWEILIHWWRGYKADGGLWLCSGRMARFAAQHPFSDFGCAYRADAVWSAQTGLFFHPTAPCPFLLYGWHNCLLAGGCVRCNLNQWRYQLEQEYFQKSDDHRCGLHSVVRSGLLWHHAPFQCGIEGSDRSSTGENRGDFPWHIHHSRYGRGLYQRCIRHGWQHRHITG